MPRFCRNWPVSQPISLDVFALSLLLSLAVMSLSSCSSRVDTNTERLGTVTSGAGGNKIGNDKVAVIPQGSLSGGGSGVHEGDMATMEVVSNGCLKAWRMACNGDEKGSIAALEDLDKHYPGVLTIQMMEGQVYEHFGRKKEAIEHYRKALSGNEFSSFHGFKLAEAMRKNGDYKGAESYYRKVLAKAPEFGAASLGLAKCLLVADKQSTEARTLLSQAAGDQLTAKEAQALLDTLEPGAKAGN
ncbi:MAG: tetratricopeptide repeat protein [Cyanobacteria bacterium SZAS LIN-3]|nr:tetratricopeptide repeat protein [Cyanobacteria bacterium SZAS LIN-3]